MILSESSSSILASSFVFRPGINEWAAQAISLMVDMLIKPQSLTCSDFHLGGCLAPLYKQAHQTELYSVHARIVANILMPCQTGNQSNRMGLC